MPHGDVYPPRTRRQKGKDRDANAKVDANITDANTTSAEKIHESAAVPTHFLSNLTPTGRMSLSGRREYPDMRWVYESCCAMTKVLSVETSCLSRKPRNQGSSAQPLETVRSHSTSAHARERIHHLEINPFNSKWGSFRFFAHSSPSIHRLSRHTPLFLRRPPPSLVRSLTHVNHCKATQ